MSTREEHIERAKTLQAKARTLRPGAPAQQSAFLDALIEIGLATFAAPAPVTVPAEEPKPAPKKRAPKKVAEPAPSEEAPE